MIQSYPSIYNLGHKAVQDILTSPVVVQEKVDGCVTPETLILTANLRYIPAGDLKIGDRLLAFQDTLRNKLAIAKVTSTGRAMKTCYDVVTETRKVTASVDHPWLLARRGNNGKAWRVTEKLLIGDHIIAFPMWEHNRSWESGCVNGFFEGEGTIVRSGDTRYVGASQVSGPTSEQFKILIAEIGFQLRAVKPRRRTNVRTGHVSQPGEYLTIAGRWPEALRFLGTVRPQRLLAKAEQWWTGASVGYLPREQVLNVSPVGEREVVSLSTSTGTYIAAGMLCHNSQFSFGVYPVGEDQTLNLRCRSKGAEIQVLAPEKMFAKAVGVVRSLRLTPGWTYRAEYLAKPKHNVLCYDRVPRSHLILFDVDKGDQDYVSPEELHGIANTLELEAVPLLRFGVVESFQDFRTLLDTTSILGGQKVEGVVIKNYAMYGPDKKVLMAKFVSEAFKEVHAMEWKTGNPSSGDILETLIAQYRTPSRWAKAVQHLREAEKLEDSPRDIGLLFKEVPEDLKREEADAIRETLFAWAWPRVQRGSCAGLAEWYKQELLKRQFDQVEEGGEA